MQLEAPAGVGLPEESLQPLLRAKQGKPLDPAIIRLDLATLYRVGAYRAVEAHAEPWLYYDERGNEAEAVLLTYAVYPAPAVGKVRVEGGDSFSRRELLEMAGITTGVGSWFPELEAPRVEEQMEASLYRRGWIEAEVSVRTEQDEDGRLRVVIEVDEGQPNVLESLTFTGDIEEVDPTRNQRRLRRWARRAGVVEGEPFDPEAVRDAQAEIRTQLASLPRWPRTRGGWITARVSQAMMRTGAGTARVTFNIEAGSQLDLKVDGLTKRQVIDALGIDERLRLTGGWMDEAPDKLTEYVRNQGYLDAEVKVALVERERKNRLRLRVKVTKGARHRLRSGFYPGFIGVDFEGNENISDADLQRVLDQASEDVLRRDYYTDKELDAGLVAARSVYAARGYLDAELELAELEKRRWGWIFPSRLLIQPLRNLLDPGYQPPVKVLPRVSVVEGPLTTVSDIQVKGAADEVDISDFEEALVEMQGAAFSPQRIEMLTRQIVLAHRAIGFLNADAKVETESTDPLVRSVAIVVRPGVQVRLRSKVTKGLNRTRPTFVMREADIPVGEPITPLDLERIRSNLYDLGVFRSVKLDLLGDEAARDLVIEVNERPRWAYELGGGLSTDQGVRAFGRLSRRNIWGRAHRIDVIGQIGLVYGSDAVTDWLPDITQPDWRLAVSYTAPRFPLRSQELVFDVARERRLERTWRMARMGGGVALDWQLGRFNVQRRETTLRIAPRVETRQLQEVDVGALLPGEPWLQLIDELPSRWRAQEALTALLLIDQRDDRVLPRKGVLSNTTAELAPGLPWNDLRATRQPITRFLKAETRMSTWVPLGGFVLELSGGAGHAFSLDEGVIPLEDRFRLGGTGSIRGFQRQVIGPRNQASRVDVDWPSGIGPLIDYATRDDPERWVPTGGDTRAQGSIEMLLPLPALGLVNWEGYALELFADFGNVWILSDYTSATTDLPEYQEDLPALRVGLGGGVRIETPVGPLQVDLAVNPQAAWSSELATRNLLVRDFEEPTWRAHLTLGATF